MDEKLRLQAEMRDNVSPGVRKIKKELDSIRTTPGMQEATKWFGNFETTAAGFVKSGGGAAGIIGAMGIGGLTAAASMATLVAQFKEMGEQALAMKELGRETGLTVDQINQFSNAGAKFGVAGDSMRGIIDSLAGQMPEFTRGTGNLFKQLSAFPNIRDKMKNEGLSDALIDGLRQAEEVAKARGPQAQKVFLEALFPGHGADAEKLFGDGGVAGIIKELDRQRQNLNPINPELLKQAQEFRVSIGDFNTSLSNFENKAGPAFLGTMATLLKGAKEFLDELNKSPEEAAKKPYDQKSTAETLGDAANDTMHEQFIGPWERWLIDKSKKSFKWFDSKSLHPEVPESNEDRSAASGLFHKSSFITGGDNNSAASQYGLDGIIAIGTKSGVLAAFREMNASASVGGGAPTGATAAAASVTGLYGLQRPHRGAGVSNDGSGLRGLGTPSAGASTSDGKGRVASWMNFFQRPVDQGGMGMDQGKAEAMVAMMQGESGANLNPGAFNPNDNGGPSGGTAQWHNERFTALQAFAKSRGKVWQDVETQQQNWRREALGSHHRTYKAIMDAADPEGALRAGVAGFEAPADVVGETRKRLGNLRRLQQDRPKLRRATGLNNDAGSGVVPQSPTGNIRADIHVHGNTSKTSIRSSGQVEAKLHRWPTMTQPSDIG